jgi:hypothetical protein
MAVSTQTGLFDFWDSGGAFLDHSGAGNSFDFWTEGLATAPMPAAPPPAPTGTIAVTAARPGLAGTGVEAFRGTGTVTAHRPGLAGVGVERITGIGVVTAHRPGVVVTGAEGFRGGAGVLTAARPGLHGTGTSVMIPRGTGAVTANRPGLAGTGVHRLVYTSKGDLPFAAFSGHARVFGRSWPTRATHR